MTVAQRVPNLGDLCDLELVVQHNDPFAMARLVKRWGEPEPTNDEMRAMSVLDLQTHFDAIAGHIRAHAMVLTADPGKRKH